MAMKSNINKLKTHWIFFSHWIFLKQNVKVNDVSDFLKALWSFKIVINTSTNINKLMRITNYKYVFIKRWQKR